MSEDKGERVFKCWHCRKPFLESDPHFVKGIVVYCSRECVGLVDPPASSAEAVEGATAIDAAVAARDREWIAAILALELEWEQAGTKLPRSLSRDLRTLRKTGAEK